MNLKEFAQQCREDSNRWFGHNEKPLMHQATHYVLGVCGESGEVAEVVKKFDRGSLTFNEMYDQLGEELVDVLIYIGNLADLLDFDLEIIYNRKREFNESRFGHGE